MARTSKSEPTVRAKLTPTEMSKGVRRFTELLEQFRTFNPDIVNDIDDAQIVALKSKAGSVVDRTYPIGTIEHSKLKDLRYVTGYVRLNMNFSTPVGEIRESMRRKKRDSIIVIEQVLEDLKEDLADHNAPVTHWKPSQ
ncbi:MAG: hypothetical protein ACR2OV_16545 [Hyphomicrobiaceae bacterium]